MFRKATATMTAVLLAAPTLATPFCPGDANGDGLSNLDDLLTVLAGFGGAGQPPFTGGDLDGDSDTDFEDLLLVLTHFGTPCPDAQLGDALDAWNVFYGPGGVTAAGPLGSFVIDSEADRAALVAAITDPALAWIPTGDVDFPHAYTAYTVADDPSIDPNRIAAWAAEVDAAVAIGDRVVEIGWDKAGVGPFITHAVFGPAGLKYDNMLSNVAGAAPDFFPREGRRCFSIRLWWLWEYWSSDNPNDWTRGYIFAENNPFCRNGQVVSCDADCQASMTGGSAKINCRSTKVSPDCCQLEYSWAWACGFKSVKVAADGFTVEVTGNIGSSGKGNGSCTVCCDGDASG